MRHGGPVRYGMLVIQRFCSGAVVGEIGIYLSV
jgi:hypothetical protein